jgi:hypothetical protein
MPRFVSLREGAERLCEQSNLIDEYHDLFAVHRWIAGLWRDDKLAIYGRPLIAKRPERFGEPVKIAPYLDLEIYWFERFEGTRFEPRIYRKPRGTFNPTDHQWRDLAIEEGDLARLQNDWAKLCRTPEQDPTVVDDLHSGRRTVEALESDTLDALATEYGGSPNTSGVAEVIEKLAEWIFAQRGRCRVSERLYEEARVTPACGPFRKQEFLEAFRTVYETKANRPPASGWLLRSPYKERKAHESDQKAS